MNLNPFTAIASVVGNAWGTYQERKTQAKQVEAELSKDRLAYKKAKIQAKTDRLLAKSTNDQNYDMQVLKNRQHTWLDEVLGIAIIAMTALAFVPGAQEYVKAGWQAVSEAPFWFQFAWYTLIVSTLGGLTVLRILMGNKIGNAIKSKMETSVSPVNGTTSSSSPLIHPTTESSRPQTEVSNSDQSRESSQPTAGEESDRRRDEDQRSHPRRPPGPPHGGGR